MTFDDVAGLIVAIVIAVYLVVALVAPERF
jgi:K+-transporting ATPase KdpF subunit